LFTSRKGYNNPLQQHGASIIIKNVANALNWKFPVATHTMRKTFGYHYYRKTKDVVGLKNMFNHRDTNVTLVYIGMVQEEVDKQRKSFKVF
jgi:site-specific recombinase XerD